MIASGESDDGSTFAMKGWPLDILFSSHSPTRGGKERRGSNAENFRNLYEHRRRQIGLMNHSNMVHKQRPRSR